MENEKVRLEFSKVELIESDGDWAITKYPTGLLVRLMHKANEIGLQGKEIDVVEVKENFATGNRYVDFIIKHD